MNSDDVAREVVGALNDVQAPYMLVGSFSSNVYGIPRSTKDFDLVVEIRASVPPID